MKAGSFIINGMYSEDIQTVIQSRPLLSTPKRRVIYKQSFGQSGSLPYDEDAYDNTELQLVLYTGGRNASLDRERLYSLFDSDHYLDLIMYHDPGKIYKVMTTEPPEFESRYYMGEGLSYMVGFTVRPYKILVDSPMIEMVQGGAIFNPTRYKSLPMIAIYGSGDITLTVNGISFVVKDVIGYLKLDSESMYAYKDTNEIITNENNKVYTRNYPYLKPGVNIISWTGTVSKVEIVPIWRTLT